LRTYILSTSPSPGICIRTQNRKNMVPLPPHSCVRNMWMAPKPGGERMMYVGLKTNDKYMIA